MDATFWQNRWKNSDTGFHRSEAHPLLTQHWPGLRLTKGSTVFVPLCGKSFDMVWLAEQGHQVAGSELSAIAIDDFFAGQNLEPVNRSQGALIEKSAGPYRLWQGDVFELTRQDVGDIQAVYDRAAIVALPPDSQRRYAKLLAALMPPSAHLFLISLSYDQSEMDGPPFSTPANTITQLFSTEFDIVHAEHNDNALAGSKNLEQRGLTQLTESLYVLKRRG